MKKLDLTSVQEATDFKTLPAGGYICKITLVEDKEDKEYLKLEFDIVEGEFKDYYKTLFENKNFWGGNFIRSYKETALSFFKAFTTAVENSNQNYKFDEDETKLKGKLIGLVLSEEEYMANDGEIKTRLYVSSVRSVDKIRKGDFKIAALKEYKGEQKQRATQNNDFVPVDTSSDSDLPF